MLLDLRSLEGSESQSRAPEPGSLYLVPYDVVMAPRSLIINGWAPYLDLGVIPSAGTLTLTGLAGSIPGAADFAFTPSVGALILTGQSLIQDFGLNLSSGSLNFTSGSPRWDFTLSPSFAQLVLSASAPLAAQGAPLIVSPGQLDLTGNTSALFSQYFLAPLVGQLDLAGASPTEIVNTFLALQSGTLTLTELLAILGVSRESTPPTGALIFFGDTPFFPGGDAMIKLDDND